MSEHLRITHDKTMEVGERKLLSWAGERTAGTWQWNNEADKKWFGASLLHDESGAPFIFYHATLENTADGNVPVWTEFSSKYIQQLGFHFGSAHAANSIVTKLSTDELKQGSGHRVFPVIISMQNPLRVDDVESFDPKSGGSYQIRLAQSLVQKVCGHEASRGVDEDGGKPGPCAKEVWHRWWAHLKKDEEEIIREEWDPEDIQELFSGEAADMHELPISDKGILEVIQSYGFDGLIYENKFETSKGRATGVDSVCVFHPHQVRSAFTGEFIWKE